MATDASLALQPSRLGVSGGLPRGVPGDGHAGPRGAPEPAAGLHRGHPQGARA